MTKKPTIETTYRAYESLFGSHLDEDAKFKLREAYFCGAAALFNALMANLDPGLVETESDMDMMAGIDAELRKWGAEFDLTYLTGGHS